MTINKLLRSEDLSYFKNSDQIRRLFSRDCDLLNKDVQKTFFQKYIEASRALNSVLSFCKNNTLSCNGAFKTLKFAYNSIDILLNDYINTSYYFCEYTMIKNLFKEIFHVVLKNEKLNHNDLLNLINSENMTDSISFPARTILQHEYDIRLKKFKNTMEKEFFHEL